LPRFTPIGVPAGAIAGFFQCHLHLESRNAGGRIEPLCVAARGHATRRNRLATHVLLQGRGRSWKGALNQEFD
jgi:hypothetical protein